LEGVLQEVSFQSSQWNSKNAPIVFYVNMEVAFSDIPLKEGSQISGYGRINALVSGVPEQFELTGENFYRLHRDLLSCLPAALLALPLHYEDIRSRALRGFSTPIPLPDSWKMI